MKNVVEQIKEFQVNRKLNKEPFCYKTEFLNVVEELLEPVNAVERSERDQAKHIYHLLKGLGNIEDFDLDPEKLVDAWADIVVYAIGGIMKLGYEPECVLEEVVKEINSRVGKIVDGKFVKSETKYKANFKRCKTGKGEIINSTDKFIISLDEGH